MKINIVTVDSQWILQKLASRLVDQLKGEHECVLSHQPEPGFDYYFYVDIQNCYYFHKRAMPDATHVGYLTHADKDSAQWLTNRFKWQGTHELDGIVSMNQRYTDMTTDIGYKGPLKTIIPPTEHSDFPMKKITLIVANRGGHIGYGHDFLLNLPDYYGLSSRFKFIFAGNGWEEIVERYKDRDIEVEHYRDASLEYPEGYLRLYHRADYLLVPILWTAGPMCGMEAHLTGLPIIASNVGFFGYELEPDFLYQPGDYDTLSEVLDKVVDIRAQRRAQVINIGGWEDYAKQVKEFLLECNSGRQS